MSARYVEALFRAVSLSANKLELQNVLSNLTAATAAATAASAAPLDHFYARIGALNGPFFPAGWGNLSVVNYEEDLRHLIQGPPSSIKLSWRLIERGNRDGTDYLLYEGSFRTPCLQRVFDALPPESRTGRVQLLVPAHTRPFRSETFNPPAPEEPPQEASLLRWSALGTARFLDPAADLQHRQQQQQQLVRGGGAAEAEAAAPACVVHLAATGDQTFGRRLRLGFPLLKDNICTMVLESPFYGARRPAAQRGSKLLRVSDLLTLGWATIAESLNLLHWLREEGYGPLGMCGLSMGGVHACMAAGLFPGDVAVTPLLAPRSAAVAYCDGAMRAVMAWEPLLKEVDENDNHISQVLLRAGRAITIQLPVRQPSAPFASSSTSSPLAAAAPAATSTSSADGKGSAASASSAAQQQCVALMREATYALADLETRGEKRHLADMAEDAEARGGAPSSADGSAGMAGSAAAEAAVGAVAAGRSSSSSGDGTSASVGSGFLRGLQSPFVSIMDVYGGLAGAALRAGGSGSGAAAAAAAGTTGSSQQQQQQPHGRQGASEQDFSGPFSGVIESDRCPPQAGPHNNQPHCGSNNGNRPAGVHTSPHGASSSARPHPQPHAPDLPFPTSQHQHSHSHQSRADSASGAATGPAAAGVAGAAATGAAAGAEAAAGAGAGGTPLGRRLLGDFGRAVKQLRADDRRLDNPDTVLRLKRVLETYTDVTRYPRPRRTDAAVIVAARDDAYVSTESVQQLHRYWQGSELRMVSGGHVSSFLMHQEAFRSAIRDSLARVSQPPRSS